LKERIAADYPDDEYKVQHLRITAKKVWKTLCHWRRWPHFFATSLVFSTWSPLTTYTPTIIMQVFSLHAHRPCLTIMFPTLTTIRTLGFDRTSANALASVGGFLALLVVIIFARISDRTNQRGLAVAGAITCYLITLIVARATQPHVGKWSRWGLWTAVNAFAVGYHPVHNTWVQLNCTDPVERSISIA
jgi:MFS family permease